MSLVADVVAVGDVMLDVELDELEPGARRHGPVHARAGGSAVTAALAAAKAGASAAVVGRIGHDAVGDVIASELRRAGVAAVLARDAVRPTGLCVAATAQRAVVAARGANAGFEPGDVPESLQAAAVLVSGYLLLHEDSTAGARVGLDRADATWVAVDAATAADARFFERAAGANAVFASADAARALTGAGPAEAARRLGHRYRLAAVTAGRDGAFVCLGGTLFAERPASQAPSDRIGSGDVFAGFLLGSLTRGADPADAVRSAVDRAARHAGAT